MRRYFILFIMAVFSEKVSAQDTLWTKTFGGEAYEVGFSVECLLDGFIIAGYTSSFGVGSGNIYIIRTNKNGDTLWTKTFGSFGHVMLGTSIQKCSSGGFVITGVVVNYSQLDGSDVVLIRIDENGNEIWRHIFPGPADEVGNFVRETSDGGFIIVGVKGTPFKYNVYLIKTDSVGNIQWAKTYGGNKDEWGSAVQECSSGGFIIVGSTSSFGVGGYDVYLIRTDENGDTLWTKTYGGEDNDYGLSIQECSDGGFIISGSTKSFGSGQSDVYIIRTDSNGNILWTKTYGGVDNESGESIQKCSDGGFIIVGGTKSFGSGGYDVYLLRIDENGDTLWTRVYGGDSSDYGYSVQECPSGGYIITGNTKSYGAGEDDVYLIRTKPVINLISPIGGEDWVGGEVYNIIWHCEDTVSVFHYRLLLSTDGGMSYPDTIADNIPNTDTLYSWTLPLINSTTCRVKVQIIDSLNNVIFEDQSDSNFTISSLEVGETTMNTPENLFVFQNKSNSFRRYITIVYYLPVKSKVLLNVYNSGGRLVKTLINGEKETGYYKVKFNATTFGSGVYFIRFTSDKYYKGTKKIILIGK